MELTNTHKKMVDILKLKGFDIESVIPFVLLLEDEQDCKKIYEWIKNNPKSDKESIWNKWKEVMEINLED